MNTDRIDPQFTEAYEPVVTYSRVPPRKRAGLVPAERVEPRLDAAEVPLIDPHDEVDPAFAMPRPEPRLDPADAGLAVKGKQGGSLSVVLLGAAFAILAGVGVLAGTIGLATIVPETRVEDAPAAETPLRLTSADAVSDIPAEPTAVREIPLAADEEVPAAEAVAIEPPLPRPRPKVEAASLEPDTATPPPPSEADVAKAPDPKPVGNARGEPAPQTTASPGPQPQGTDALISSIEATLDKIDSTPPAAASANSVTASPPVLPPPSLDPLASAPPLAPPPLDDDCPPSDTGFDPCYDVMPPPPLTGGYYQAGPVPPEPVPYPYPPTVSDGDATFAEDFGAVEPEGERRPGIVRRAITKTADAVERVFSRDD